MSHRSSFSAFLLVGAAALAACAEDGGESTTDPTTTTTTGVGAGGAGAAGGAGGQGGDAGGAGGASSTGGSGGAASCYADQPCDPLEPLSCGDPASACDLGVSTPNSLECYPSGNTRTLGESCKDPVWCQHGLTCPASLDVCVEYCCTTDDCTMGTCQPHPDHDPTEAGYVVSVCLP